MKNSQTFIDWQPAKPLPTAPGVYFVWLKKPMLGSHVQTMRINVGGIRTIGNHFDFDILTRDQEILAWAEQGNPPNFELLTE